MARKRKEASNIEGTPCSPILMTVKVAPQTATIRKAKARSLGVIVHKHRSPNVRLLKHGSLNRGCLNHRRLNVRNPTLDARNRGRR